MFLFILAHVGVTKEYYPGSIQQSGYSYYWGNNTDIAWSYDGSGNSIYAPEVDTQSYGGSSATVERIKVGGGWISNVGSRRYGSRSLLSAIDGRSAVVSEYSAIRGCSKEYYPGSMYVGSRSVSISTTTKPIYISNQGTYMLYRYYTNAPLYADVVTSVSGTVGSATVYTGSYSYFSDYDSSVDNTASGYTYGTPRRNLAGGVYNNTASYNGTRSMYCNLNLYSKSSEYTIRGCNYISIILELVVRQRLIMD